MNKLGVLAFAAQFAPRLFQVPRRTWIYNVQNGITRWIGENNPVIRN